MSYYDSYSVLMAVYKNDNAIYLKESIESMLNQTVKPKQFVIVEDGKIPEDLEKVILSYEKKYPEIFNVIRRDINKGLGYSLNEGLQICKYSLIARMDSDDISIDTRCEKQLREFKKNKDLKIIGGQIVEFINDVGNLVGKRNVPCENEKIIRFSHRRSPFNHPTVMFKRDTVIKYGGYPEISRKEDLKLFVEMVNCGEESMNLEDVVLYYRTSRENLKRRKTFINCKEYIEVMYYFYKRNIINIKDFIYVFGGQIFLFVVPDSIAERASNLFLRE